MEFAPMSNRRAVRMVFTDKREAKKIVLGSVGEWDKSLHAARYGYRRRQMLTGISQFELLYGVPPRVEVVDD